MAYRDCRVLFRGGTVQVMQSSGLDHGNNQIISCRLFPLDAYRVLRVHHPAPEHRTNAGYPQRIDGFRTGRSRPSRSISRPRLAAGHHGECSASVHLSLARAARSCPLHMKAPIASYEGHHSVLAEYHAADHSMPYTQHMMLLHRSRRKIRHSQFDALDVIDKLSDMRQFIGWRRKRFRPIPQHSIRPNSTSKPR